MAANGDDRIFESLQELGFSQYEAKLYVGLVRNGPLNGNELSRSSGVPSSKVYSTLERLDAAGIVARTPRANGYAYVSTAPRDVLRKLRQRFIEPLNYLDEALPALGTSTPEPDVLQLRGDRPILEHAQAIIRGAHHEVYLSVWEETAEHLLGELTEARERGVRIAGMLYGAKLPDVGWWQQHSYRETVSSRIRGRMLTMVSDASDALIAYLPTEGEASAFHTRNPVLVLVAEEYLIHDMTLQKAKTMTGYQEWDRWLRSDKEVKALTLGRTGHLSPIEPNA